jgi:hypothetical protein
MKVFSTALMLSASAQTHTYPTQYQCFRQYEQQGVTYSATVVIDKEGEAKSAVIKTSDRAVSFNSNKTTYGITPNWCQPGTLYTPVTDYPAMPLAYKYLGDVTMNGILTERFGENDQYVNASVYFKKGSWEPVAAFDSEQQKAGMKDGLIYFSKCTTSIDESAFDVPSNCFQ